MADESEGLSYAEMIRRQSAEDVARWHAAEAERLWRAGTAVMEKRGNFVLAEIVKADGDDRTYFLARLSPDPFHG